MDQNSLFMLGLGLSAPWKVVRSGLESSGEGTMFLYVDIEVEPGSTMPCPCCGKLCPLYDHEVKRWRYMNFWQHATYLSARVPRVQCAEHNIRKVNVPWARPESGFTLLFEAFVMALAREPERSGDSQPQAARRASAARQMPISAVAELTAEHDTRLWRIVRHYVKRAHGKQDWSGIQAVAVDDTATRKGHKYATVVVELDLQKNKSARLLFMTPDRTAASVGEFVKEMPAHGAKPEQVQLTAMDMSAAYQKGARELLPLSKIVFDRFHVMQLASNAIDEVRK
jgi:transposase